MGRGLLAQAVDVADEGAHVVGGVLVAAGERPGEGIDDDQQQLQIGARGHGGLDGIDQRLEVGGGIEQVDRDCDQEKRQVIGRVIVPAEGLDALAHAEAALGGDVDHDAALDLAAEEGLAQGDAEAEIEDEKALARAGLAIPERACASVEGMLDEAVRNHDPVLLPPFDGDTGTGGAAAIAAPFSWPPCFFLRRLRLRSFS